jgi:hypothetical protein
LGFPNDASTEERIVVSGQLEDSLRHEVESYLEGRLSGVKQEIAELQSRLNESLSRLLDRQGEVQLDGSVAASILEHLRAAHEEGIDLAAAESSRAKASSDMAIVKAAVAEIGEQKAQSEILKTLVNRAASFAPRVAFFVVKGEQSIGWRARGFEGTVGDSAIQQISFSIAADTAIGDAANSKATWSGGPHTHSEDHVVLNRLGEEAPQRIVAVPLVARGRTVAVLYADSAGLDSEAINLEALETLVRVSGMAVELLATRTAAAKRTAPESQAEEALAPQEPAAAYVPTLEYEETQAIVADETAPEPRPAEPQPWTVEAQPEAVEAQPERNEPQPERFETPVVPVFSPISPQSAPTPLVARRRYGMDAELPVSVASEEERRLHNDARRFARLLVSEIKLYNEQKVAEGRSQFDLYERLREYIDRSREMYDKRVKPEVARKYDYFHHELVNTLAEGDTAKLGNAYPGATVSA